MPTKFAGIYERALFKFTDYSFLNIENEIKDVALQNYLLSAISDFQHSCKVDLNDYDLEAKQFNVELGNEEIEILSIGITFYWLNAKVLNAQHLKNIIHNKDYTSYSPANLLNAMISLRDEIESDYKGRINLYSIRNSSIDTLKV